VTSSVIVCFPPSFCALVGGSIESVEAANIIIKKKNDLVVVLFDVLFIIVVVVHGQKTRDDECL